MGHAVRTAGRPAGAAGRRRRSRGCAATRPTPAGCAPPSLGLLAATAVLYLWGLGASGWANSFYSAAAQAGSQSWKALFFGSSDSSNFITVDKPPAALWVMGLSVRLFGLNAWSLLVPEALMGVASVGVLYLTVKRWFGAGAGLLAGAVMALTPVAVLMFRFNNPDALLVLVLTIGAYCVTRALEAASGRWLSLAFALVGLGFLTKMLQAVLVLPAFGLVYLVAAPNPLRKRDRPAGRRHARCSSPSFGWWIAIVELLPASARPYVGGSQDNSVLSLIFGYNGFGRLTGNETGSVGGGGGNGGGMWGETGWLRLFNSEFGGQASWLLPAALVLLVAGLALTVARRPHRPHPRRADPVGRLARRHRRHVQPRSGDHPPVLHRRPRPGARRPRRDRRRRAVAAPPPAGRPHRPVGHDRRDGVVDAAAARPLADVERVAAAARRRHRRHRRRSACWPRRTSAAGCARPSSPRPSSAAWPRRPRRRSPPRRRRTTAPSRRPARSWPAGSAAAGARAARPRAAAASRRRLPGGAPTGQAARPTGGGGGGVGGILQSSEASAELTAALQADADAYTWVAATIGANQAAGYQLASEQPVMAIGGFNGSDPWPTLAAFQQYVASGEIHYFIAGGQGGGPGGGGDGTASEITAWVEANFAATTIGGTTVYDLTT